ncbi:MAG: polysaccharide biosynthesis C-terminal domain-containing protein [Hyphomicrobiales bacterium]|nr:polysaccharide biosynthesis C-terminal domain-containing protein [Hyphomicrobiales bacterium]MDE2017388.1 polysaccharide biosynthesis C-terminal domain-containing protein [Hyphomicrobiales bacterium]
MKTITIYAANSLMNFVVGLAVARWLGPHEYGRFALGLSVAAFLAMAFFDWTRLCAIRFYSEETRVGNPRIRATLDAAFATAAGIVALGAAILALAGVKVAASTGLLFAAALGGATMGLYEYQTALLRARFADRAYAHLVLARNAFALVVSAGGAYVFHSALFALFAFSASSFFGMAFAIADLRDGAGFRLLADRAQMSVFVRYAAPILASDVLYQAVPLGNRALISLGLGYAATGRFSLPFDLGIKLFGALGATLDVLLFQLAVRAERVHGVETAQAQVARNMALVVAVAAPVATGLWLVLPSLNALLIPPEFRATFAPYLTVLLPGLFAFVVGQYAAMPVLKLAHRTAPVFRAGLAAVVVDFALVALTRGRTDASGFVLAQSASFVAGAFALAVSAARLGPALPPAKDWLAPLVGCLAMAAAVWPLRGLPPGAPALALQAAVGAAVYAAALWAADVAGLRAEITARWKPPGAPAAPI